MRRGPASEETSAHPRALRFTYSRGRSIRSGQAISGRRFIETTARYATFVVLAHTGVVFWHLVLVAKITPGLSDNQVLAATAAISLVPTVALALLWAHFLRLGGVLLFFPSPLDLASEVASIL